jgi:RNA polymerase sigma factor (sigma-70 family)
MDATLTKIELMTRQDRNITATVMRESSRLRDFIRRRIADPAEAEDILQDVFTEFVQAYRLPEPIEQVGAWLFRVARNRIIDRFRMKKAEPMPETSSEEDNDPALRGILPEIEAGPAAAYARSVLLAALQQALDELPPAQREVFVAHELDGRSFKEMSASSGIAINTLLARKRYAVLRLRERLQDIYDELDH